MCSKGEFTNEGWEEEMGQETPRKEATESDQLEG